MKAFEKNKTLSELNKTLKMLKPRKSPRLDGIHNEMPIHLGPVAKKILPKISNITWQKGDLPPIWKTAILKQIFNKGKSTEKTVQLSSHILDIMQREYVNGRHIFV